MGRLDNKVALITGGAVGLGAAIATRFVEEGAQVALVDLDQGAAQETAAKLGDAAIGLGGDVTNEDAVIAATNAAVEKFGKLNVVVNNAGIEGQNAPTDQLSLAEWERVMAVNTNAVFLCTKHTIAPLRAAGGGSIINISSIYGILGAGDVPPYHASKGAVRTMTKNDAICYAPDNIRVNSIHPGFIFTSMVDRFAVASGLSDAQAHDILEPLHPLGTGHPDDIAWLAVYLASEQAKWMTGSEVVIDGGYSAR
ncbi:MAG: SDR family NAD(P)-dependent oxidoreductase [Beutenbergiaceae bacterium]